MSFIMVTFFISRPMSNMAKALFSVIIFSLYSIRIYRHKNLVGFENYSQKDFHTIYLYYANILHAHTGLQRQAGITHSEHIVSNKLH